MKSIQSHSHSLISNDNCPVCYQSSQRLFQKHGYWIRHCQACKHHFAEVTTSPVHVNQVYSEEYFYGGGAGYSNYLTEAKILRKRGQWYGRLLSRYTQPGTVLDVGAAAGFILQGLIDCGWQGKGIEPNPDMVNYACTHLGLSVDVGTLEQLQVEERYDLINMIQVLGHFFDIRQALQVASLHTKPGGFWLIETSSRESFTARILGNNWHMYSPPSVLHWFSPSGLQQLAGQFGFYEIARGRPAKWILGSHAKSVLRYKLGSSSIGKNFTEIINIIPDHLPLPYPAEDLFWVLFQKRNSTTTTKEGKKG
ncbi:class I SAM-dependent methyltransferase [Tolypothrix campylonemoides VB511288]|nr:class I SAM-dependent methyltransferase [Tolypothrix campylonemoides VB511288]